MSPFAEALRTLRLTRGLRQGDLAGLLHCDRTRISAVENDLRGGVSAEFLRNLSNALDLTPTEMLPLVEAARTSQRSYLVGSEAHPKAYRLARQLFERLDRMPEAHLDVLLGVLNSFSPTAYAHLPATSHRLWRKDKLWKEESVA